MKTPLVRYIIFVVVSVFSVTLMTAQDEQDCIEAIPVCEGFYNQTEGYTGTGSIGNELPSSFSSCLTVDANSVWYTFTVETSGMLSFILSPNGVDSDYDWILFDFSTGSCDDISNDDSYIVSCNSYGDFDFNGPTGISSANGGTGSSNGPGNTNGPPFNQDIAVTAGETYLLYIQDWSGNSQGYTLDFNESTASIFDSEPPVIETVTTDCTGDVHVQMSESIVCDNLEPEDFIIIDGMEMYVPIDVESNCSGASSGASEFTLIFTNATNFTENATLTLEISQDNGLLSDACGNVIEDFTFDFQFAGDVSFEISITDPTCGNDNGIISIENVQNALLPIDVNLDANPQAGVLLNNLGADTYIVSITDQLGCSAEIETTLSEIPVVQIDAGMDNGVCGLTYNMTATSSGGATYSWTGPAGINFNDNTDLNTSISSNISGNYQIELTAVNTDGCIATDDVEITFSNLMTSSVVGDPICGSSCDAEVDISASGGVEPYTIIIDGIADNSFNLQNACVGDYNYTITDNLNCTVTSNFIIDQLDNPQLLTSNVSHETCPGACDGEITITASNTIDFSSPQGDFNASGSLLNLCSGNYQIVLESPDNCLVSFSESINTLSNLSALLGTYETPITLDDPWFIAENLSSGDFVNSTLLMDGQLIPMDTLIATLHVDMPDGDPFPVELIIEDQYGCVDSDMKIVEYSIPLQVYIPNSFTPNNDQINEVFKPSLRGFDPSQYELSIFNRWGELIFHTKDFEEGWNGNDQNGDHYSAPGVYHYKLVAKQKYTSLEKEYFGQISLVR